jgi:two-component system, NarL family, response regulator LiaR
MDKVIKKEANSELGNQITILIADDHPLVREALRNLVDTQQDMTVIGEASNGEEAVKLAKALMPDVIIMDIGMPVMNGLEATRIIKKECPGIAILVLTVYTDDEHIIGILEAGAAGYLTKAVFGKDVLRAIEAIAAGEAVLTPSVLLQILGSVKSFKQNVPVQSPETNLSTREIHILKLAAKGLSNKIIATNLNLTEGTIKSYLVSIFSKINVSSRTEAVITGLKTGLVNFQDLE